MAANTAKVFACLDCTVGSTLLTGVTHGRINYMPFNKSDPIHHQKAVVKTDRVQVEIYGVNPTELVGLLTTTPAAVVFGVRRDDGSRGTETLALVQLVEPIGQVEIAESDSGGKVAVFGIRGWCQGITALAAKWVSA